MQRADFGLAYDAGTSKLYAMGGDLTGGTYFDPSNEVDELGVGTWPSGTWVTSTPTLPTTAQANNGGYFGNGAIYTFGSYITGAFQTYNYYRSNGGGACGTPTPTPTQGQATATPVVTATPTACVSGAIQNGGFESGSFSPGWTILDTAATPTVRPSPSPVHSGSYAAFLGSDPGTEPLGDSSIYQQFTVPTGGGTLSYWYYPYSEDTITYDWQDAYITDVNGNILTTIMHVCDNTQTWTHVTQDLSAYAGQTVRIKFLVHQDGFGDVTNMYVDDVSISGQCGSPGPTNTPSGPTATPTCSPSGAGWSAGPDLPTTLVRAVGVYFPADGMFYSVGGRTSDNAGSDFQHVLQYNPSTNTWTQKGVTLPDTNMNNMACGVLTVSGTAQIYCVGGSTAGQTTATARVFSYNPATDTATVLNSADNWPGDASGTILPGGFAVTGNKLYILGGFDINTASTNQIWQFDPTQAQGSKWLQRVNAPEGIMYAPTAAIGGMIYVAGASDYQGGTVVDTTNSFSFNPATNTIGNIMAIPRATGETRGLVVGGMMWVLGGGRVAPNPSNEVDIYNPGTNSWSVGTPFVNARRNFPADSDGSHVWLAGGYEPSTAAMDMEIYSAGTPCGTPVASPTTPPATATSPAATATSPAATSTRPAATATSPAATSTRPAATATSPAATPTACTIQFSDVPVGSTFYPYIHCLACLGIVNGYPDGTFRPNANVTRGQLSKIVANSAGFNDTPSGQQFQDVPIGSTFYVYIYRLVHRGYISGYPCGGPGEPCVPPDNLPYFRPNAYATRGQISKIVSNAAGFNDTPSGQQFQDVPVGSTFYDYIYRLSHRGIISGYACGGPGEPCVPPANLPYFRPNNDATRGQMSKIDGLAFFPNCNIPARPQATNY
jgi:hypothetical protein